MAMTSLEEFQEQFRKLKDVEAGKDILIEAMLFKIKELEKDLAEEKLGLERERETAKTYQTKFRHAEAQLSKANQRIFTDTLVKSGQQGGHDAAVNSTAAVKNYIAEKFELPSLVPIRVRIYANTGGLASTYFSHQILGIPDALNALIRGFNMAHPMCDFVDAGDWKESTESKLKVLFKQDVTDPQCKAVFLGGLADGSYAPDLQLYVGDDLIKGQIILIEGPLFGRDLAVLKDEFLITSFPSVFRGSKIPPRLVPLPTTRAPIRH